MNKKIVTIALLILFVVIGLQPVFSQEQSCYNRKGGFSLTIPRGWEEYSNEEMRAISSRISAGANRNVRYDAGLKKIGHTLPYMFAVIGKGGKFNEKQIQDAISSQGQNKISRKVVDVLNKSSFSNIISGYKPVDSLYQPNRHLFLITKKYSYNNKPQILLQATFFSNYGFVSLFFYSAEHDFKSNLNDFLAIIDSFDFSKQNKYWKEKEIIREN